MAASVGQNVTFVFSDIVGSTGLWEQDASAMRAAVARHDLIAAAAVHGNSGHVVKHLGDGIFAAFAEAGDAVAAALQFQSVLAAETWPTASPLEVRVAVHTGRAELRDGDYFGPTVNRCSRLAAIGYGGQVLLSSDAAAVVQHRLPEGAWLEDLGPHRLRDLSRSEHVWQLSHPSLRAEFPALRSLDSFANNLPVQLTSFVGREREIETVRDLLATRRLVTLVGPGGSGKTRLALQVAGNVLHRYPDGAWLVPLESLSPGAEIGDALASALRLRDEPGKDALSAVRDHAAVRHMLMLVDNCEHVAASAAAVLEFLLRSCPDLSVLATSRERLSVPGEQMLEVPALSCSVEHGSSVARLVSNCEAARLFIDRAQAVKLDYSPTDADAPVLAEICAHLDGMPLAIELAAARIGVLTARQIADRIDRCFRLLSRGARTAEPRQQTLYAAVEWSYELLSSPERALFVRLSVFRGDADLVAVEAVCSGGGVEEADVLDLLSELVDKSLVQVRELDGRCRYRMLESVRQFAAEKLGPALSDLRVRHAEYYAGIARLAAQAARSSIGDGAAPEWAPDVHNLQQAAEWAMSSGATQIAYECCAGMWRYLRREGRVDEARRFVERVLAAGTDCDSGARAEVLSAAGTLAFERGDHDFARARWEEARALAEDSGDRWGATWALGNLANLAAVSGDHDRAEEVYRRCLATMTEMGDSRGAASTLVNLAYLARQRGRPREALDLCAAGAREMQAIGNYTGAAHALGLMASITYSLGDVPRSVELYRRAARSARQAADKRVLGRALTNLAECLLELGEVADARPYAEEGLALRRELRDDRNTAASLRVLSAVALAEGDAGRSESLAAESLRMAVQVRDATSVGPVLKQCADAAEALGRHEEASAYRAAEGLPGGEALAAASRLMAAEAGHLRHGGDARSDADLCAGAAEVSV